MSKLIAIVAVAMLVGGIRTEYLPGEEVPGLNPVDADDLKRMGAVYDADELAAEQKLAARAEKAAGAEFAKARKDVLAKSEAVEDQAS